MLYNIKKHKTVINTPSKSGSSTLKSYLRGVFFTYDKKVPSAENPHSPILEKYLKERHDAIISVSKAEYFHREKKYRLYIIGRDPLSRFVSGMNQKFIDSYPNANVNVIDHRIGNFYKWFRENISVDMGQVTNKHLIDFHCRNIDHTFEIDRHFDLVTNQVSEYFIENCEVISLNDKLLDNLNKIFGLDIKIGTRNVSGKNNDEANVSDFDEDYFLNNCIYDKRALTECTYMISSVKKYFKKDFDFYEKADYYDKS